MQVSPDSPTPVKYDGFRFPDAISRGSHASPDEGACVMELTSLFAGEPFSDHPQCACPVITRFAIAINDRMPDDATRTRLLGPLVSLIAGSRSTPEVERQRAFLAADYAIRVFAPLALAARGFHDHAARLRAVAPIRNAETARAGRAAADAADAAADAADAAADAADAAAYAAAYAAYAAAYAADAAAYAAYAAAYAAYAVDAAAYAAAYAVDAAVDAAVWEQGVAGLRAMCEITAGVPS